jgi:hypothetical protein
MPQPSVLYDTLLNLLKQAPWRDRRHLSTLAWMVAGLLSSGWVALDEWTPYVTGRAVFAQSTVRRFGRWLSNPRIDVLRMHAALLRPVLEGLRDARLYVVLDTTMLWGGFCVVQLSLSYRGRSIPLAWKVLKHASSSVAFRDYRGVLGFAARLLRGREVVLLADRGFVHGELLAWVRGEPGWHFRVRGKRDMRLFRWGGKGFRRLALRLSAGEVRHYHGIYLSKAHLPVNLSVGWEKGAKEPWIVVSDEPTDAETLREYGLRFSIEEGFLDHKSGGFQWESSKLRDAKALQRLCFVMAVATLVLVCQGVAVVDAGKRRQVDPHWFRGLSYARIGWNWIRRAIARGEALVDRLALLTAQDPEPARASRRQPDRSRWMYDLPCGYVFLFPAPSTT